MCRTWKSGRRALQTAGNVHSFAAYIRSNAFRTFRCRCRVNIASNTFQFFFFFAKNQRDPLTSIKILLSFLSFFLDHLTSVIVYELYNFVEIVWKIKQSRNIFIHLHLEFIIITINNHLDHLSRHQID